MNMKSMLGKIIPITLVVAAVTATAAERDSEFKSIFDGKTLAGWNAADMSYWSIEDGAITMTCEFCALDFRFERDEVRGTAGRA